MKPRIVLEGWFIGQATVPQGHSRGSASGNCLQAGKRTQHADRLRNDGPESAA